MINRIPITITDNLFKAKPDSSMIDILISVPF